MLRMKLICVECGYRLPVLNLSSMQHILYTMIKEKISSEVIGMKRQEQEEKQAIQQQLAMNSKGSSDTNGSVDETKLQEFIGKVLNEWGAAEGALITFVGDRLGLFKAMAGAGELTPEELARKTGTHPRIIKEWLAGQAAGGFVHTTELMEHTHFQKSRLLRSLMRIAQHTLQVSTNP